MEEKIVIDHYTVGKDSCINWKFPCKEDLIEAPLYCKLKKITCCNDNYNLTKVVFGFEWCDDVTAQSSAFQVGDNCTTEKFYGPLNSIQGFVRNGAQATGFKLN